MEYRKLGSSDLDVSRVCLGSMTWGFQNNQNDADTQIEYAFDKGVNFIDTAELYAVPPTAETYGKTETIIGNWIANNREKRESFILASKIAGPGFDYIRKGSPITGKSVKLALDGSLKRLQTDYIDLYQLHWPNRQTAHFSKHWPNMISFSQTDTKAHTEQMQDILESLQECIAAGKIRHCGLSDDSPWGIQTYIELSKKYDLPRMVSIQNEFNLLHTKDWPYLIEQCIHEDIAYLPWSPMAGGMLSGKYIHGARPTGSRWSLQPQSGLFRDTKNGEQAVIALSDVAQRHGYTTAQLALAWCNSIDGVTSTIIGATTMDQLKENIAAFDKTINEEIANEIDSVLRNYPLPF
ncbi:MAG: aldo/keto reductase [Magnetococcales bacterium]|nr:aldo/keto reductase [Magnetococcales bacterium]